MSGKKYCHWEKMLLVVRKVYQWEKSFSLRKTFLIEIIVSQQEKPFFEKYFNGRKFLSGRKVSDWKKGFLVEEKKFLGAKKGSQ